MHTYEEAMHFIQHVESKGIRPGLERVAELLKRMGDPQEQVNMIHVAGSNGKGSVCTYMASILMAAGYSVGRYISPVIEDYREKLQINGEWITEADVTKLLTLIESHCKQMEAEYGDTPSGFEIETAMAFQYFKEKQPDFVILEVGMGGALDATNVIKKPLASVITHIAMDHMAYLGNTRAEIASVKAGIIKKDVPVIVLDKDHEVHSVIEDMAMKMSAKVYDADRASVREATIKEGLVFDAGAYQGLRTKMSGLYQADNASLAIKTIDVLKQVGKADKVTSSAVFEGIGSAGWEGRFELLQDHPVLIVDGAHNPDGAEALVRSYKAYYEKQKCILVMGVFKDKAYIEMLRIVSEISDILITFKPAGDRGLSADLLAKEAETCFEKVIPCDSHQKAMMCAFDLSSETDVIIHMGSLSTIASLKKIIKEIKQNV